MIPSAKLKTTQIVMLAYNIWRYMKIIANQSVSDDRPRSAAVDGSILKSIISNTDHIARLKLQFIVAKVSKMATATRLNIRTKIPKHPQCVTYYNI